MPDISISTLVLGLVAFTGGFLSALGGSSGILLLPTLLLMGYPAPLALGTNKLYTTVSLFSSTVHFIHKKVFVPHLWFIPAMVTFVGACMGVGLVELLNPKFLKMIIPFFIVLSAVYSLIEKATMQQNQIQLTDKFRTTNIFSTILGIYSGFIGAGTSLFWFAFLRRFYVLDLITANAIANFMSFIANLSALIIFFLFGQVEMMMGILLAFLGALGAYLGSRVALKHGRRLIKPMIVLTTCLISFKLVNDAW